mgnify:CR=1 FL=1
MATVASAAARDKWMQWATEAQKQKHDENAGHYHTIPLTVLPTATILTLPDQAFKAALCDATMHSQPPPSVQCYCHQKMTRTHTNGYGYPMQTTSCTWPYVVPIGEDPAAHGHWCAFTDLYHTIP